MTTNALKGIASFHDCRPALFVTIVMSYGCCKWWKFSEYSCVKHGQSLLVHTPPPSLFFANIS